MPGAVPGSGQHVRHQATEVGLRVFPGQRAETARRTRRARCPGTAAAGRRARRWTVRPPTGPGDRRRRAGDRAGGACIVPVPAAGGEDQRRGPLSRRHHQPGLTHDLHGDRRQVQQDAPGAGRTARPPGPPPGTPPPSRSGAAARPAACRRPRSPAPPASRAGSPPGPGARLRQKTRWALRPSAPAAGPPRPGCAPPGSTGAGHSRRRTAPVASPRAGAWCGTRGRSRTPRPRGR